MRKNILFSLLAVMCTLTVSAQENKKDYEPYPYTFVSVQGGGQMTLTDISASNLITPIGAVSVGRFFIPGMGARLNVQGWKSKSGYEVGGKEYTFDYNYVTTDIDFLFNLCNIFSPKKVHPLNVMLIGGFGFNYAWDNADGGYNSLAKQLPLSEPTTWSDGRISHNIRLGAALEANVSKHIGINLEVTANNTDDRFNSKRDNSDDWQIAALVGVTYKFGFHKKRQSDTGSALSQLDYDNARSASAAVATTPVVEGTVQTKEEPQPVVEPEVKKENVREEIFFTINSSEVTAVEKNKVKKLAEWLKQHPTAKVNLTAYADAGTGTSKINRKISQKRVVSVKDMLVKEFGIAPERIATEYKGDTEQPFKENDKNRVTIVIASEQ